MLARSSGRKRAPLSTGVTIVTRGRPSPPDIASMGSSPMICDNPPMLGLPRSSPSEAARAAGPVVPASPDLHAVRPEPAREAALKLRLGLWALFSTLFTLAVVHYSLRHGRLIADPIYDDIAYLSDGLQRL